MRESIEMARGIFYIIVGLCATIILMSSLEVMMRVKDTGMFEMWLSNPSLNTSLIGQTVEEMYSTYVTMNLSTFFVRIVTPMGLTIHSYLTLTKFRVNKIFVAIWSVVLIGSFGFSILGESIFTIFFIISGMAYVALILTMIYLGKCIYNIRSL